MSKAHTTVVWPILLSLTPLLRAQNRSPPARTLLSPFVGESYSKLARANACAKHNNVFKIQHSGWGLEAAIQHSAASRAVLSFSTPPLVLYYVYSMTSHVTMCSNPRCIT